MGWVLFKIGIYREHWNLSPENVKVENKENYVGLWNWNDDKTLCLLNWIKKNSRLLKWFPSTQTTSPYCWSNDHHIWWDRLLPSYIKSCLGNEILSWIPDINNHINKFQIRNSFLFLLVPKHDPHLTNGKTVVYKEMSQVLTENYYR